MTAPQVPARRCSAHTRDGTPCKNAPIKAGTVCRMHGGSAPQVRRAARLRLWELVDPAVAVLARVMANHDERTADRLRAAENVLDRAGWPRRSQVEPVDPDALTARIIDLRDTIDADTPDTGNGTVASTGNGSGAVDGTPLPPQATEPLPLQVETVAPGGNTTSTTSTTSTSAHPVEFKDDAGPATADRPTNLGIKP